MLLALALTTYLPLPCGLDLDRTFWTGNALQKTAHLNFLLVLSLVRNNEMLGGTTCQSSFHRIYRSGGLTM
jgi:hypothetical protein